MSHIDRRPLGDMGSTITTLIAGHNIKEDINDALQESTIKNSPP
jgi:hypothetical protein